MTHSGQKPIASECACARGKRDAKGLIIDEPWIGLILSGEKTKG